MVWLLPFPGMAGKAIAGGLCDAAAAISPYEAFASRCKGCGLRLAFSQDVRGYLQQTVPLA